MSDSEEEPPRRRLRSGEERSKYKVELFKNYNKNRLLSKAPKRSPPSSKAPPKSDWVAPRYSQDEELGKQVEKELKSLVKDQAKVKRSSCSKSGNSSDETSIEGSSQSGSVSSSSVHHGLDGSAILIPYTVGQLALKSAAMGKPVKTRGKSSESCV